MKVPAAPETAQLCGLVCRTRIAGSPCGLISISERYGRHAKIKASSAAARFVEGSVDLVAPAGDQSVERLIGQVALVGELDATLC